MREQEGGKSRLEPLPGVAAQLLEQVAQERELGVRQAGSWRRHLDVGPHRLDAGLGQLDPLLAAE